MKVLYINSMYNGSTGKLMRLLATTIEQNGNKAYLAFPEFDGKGEGNDNEIIIGNKFDSIMHHILGRLTGQNDCFGHIVTWFFLKRIDKIKPDIIHLHNLHNCYINIKMLFTYIKKNQIPVIWTLHDCWAYTGHCVYYSLEECDKWKHGCSKCGKIPEYPKSYFDNSKYMFKYKKKIFSNLEQLILVTPSQWLASEVKKSFLKMYPLRTIYNGIDLELFKNTNSEQVRQKYQCQDKFIILGVAYKWGYRKGFDVFNFLADVLDDNTYKLIVVGADSKDKKMFHAKIEVVEKTKNQYELARFYSMADVFLNPTREEVLGLVNIEALACGTPVITFDSGGSPETISEQCGYVVEKDSMECIINYIEKIRRDPITSKKCRERSQFFSMEKMCKQYCELYNEVILRN